MAISFPSVSEGIKYFVENHGDDVNTALEGSGIYFAVVVGQACDESGFGTSHAALTKNNFLGIMRGRHTARFTTPLNCFQVYVRTLLNKNHDYIKSGLLTATTPQDQLLAIANGGFFTDPPAASYYKKVNKMRLRC